MEPKETFIADQVIAGARTLAAAAVMVWLEARPTVGDHRAWELALAYLRGALAIAVSK